MSGLFVLCVYVCRGEREQRDPGVMVELVRYYLEGGAWFQRSYCGLIPVGWLVDSSIKKGGGPRLILPNCIVERGKEGDGFEINFLLFSFDLIVIKTPNQTLD